MIKDSSYFYMVEANHNMGRGLRRYHQFSLMDWIQHRLYREAGFFI